MFHNHSWLKVQPQPVLPDHVVPLAELRIQVGPEAWLPGQVGSTTLCHNQAGPKSVPRNRLMCQVGLCSWVVHWLCSAVGEVTDWTLWSCGAASCTPPLGAAGDLPWGWVGFLSGFLARWVHRLCSIIGRGFGCASSLGELQAVFSNQARLYSGLSCWLS